MSEFTFKVNLVAVVGVRAADESDARQVVSTILGAPGTVEIGLANENNAAVGNHATITDVDFSFSLGSIKRFGGNAQDSTALLQAVTRAVTQSLAQMRMGHPGRIYEVRGGPDHLRWFWALHFPSKPESLRTDNRVATLEAAKAEFEASWEAWKAWAKLKEAP